MQICYHRVLASWTRHFFGYIAAILLVSTMLLGLLPATETSALTTTPTKMNFQGRLTDSAGTTMPDGLYNMKFRLFTVASGGTDVWNETRETTNRVQVTNGLFSVQLGAVTPISTSLFASGSLYFEVELPTPATATCGTGSCQTWTEGPMTTRSILSTSAYAFNSETLDGLDSTEMGQLAAANLWTNINNFKVTSATALQVQNAGSIDLLVADTSNTIVKIGNPGTATLANVRLFTNTAEVSGTLRVGDATNGVEFSTTSVIYRGTARPTKVITLAPEYAGATFTGDGSNNTGTLSSDFCSSSSLLNINASVCGSSADEHNYYSWTTTQASAQDYDIYIRYRLPNDYDTGSMTDMKIFGWGTTSANEVVSLALYKGSGTACGAIANAITGNTSWNEGTQASPLGACSIAGGDLVTFKVHLVAGQNNTARAGEISFTYRSKM